MILLGDLQLQKQTWYKPKMANIIKCLAVTALNGKFAAIFPLATSISPKSGDTYLVSAFLKHQDCSQTDDILPFRRLLQGSDDKFLLMFSDSGFEHLAPQVLFINTILILPSLPPLTTYIPLLTVNYRVPHKFLCLIKGSELLLIQMSL